MKTKLLILVVLLFNQFSHAQVVEEWVQRYNGPGNGVDQANSIALDNAGNVYITGFSAGSGSGDDYATIKYDPEGVLQWLQRYSSAGGGSKANSIALDNFGNVYVTGLSNDGSGSSGYTTIKYNSEGVQQWVKRYDGPGDGYDIAYSIVLDNSGNVYVTGVSYGGTGTGWDYATIKYSTGGVQQWVQRYNGPGNGYDSAKSIALDSSGNIYVTGVSDGTGAGTNGFDFVTIKYNAGGVQLWVQRYNGLGNGADGASSIALDNSGNVYVTGSSLGSGTSLDYATIKYNSEGVQQWVQWYDGPSSGGDGGGSIVVDTSGNVYVTGYSSGSGTTQDYATINYNPEGVQQWVQRYNGPGNLYDYSNRMVLDNAGNVYVTGYSVGSGTSYDYATIKYSEDVSTVAWSNAAGGIFSDTSNWVGGTVPDTSQTALFDESFYATSYAGSNSISKQPITITFDDVTTTVGLRVRKSQLIYDLQAHSFGVNDISVGSSQADFPHESQLEIINGALGTTAPLFGSMGIGTLGKRGEVIVNNGGILEVEGDNPGANLEIGVGGDCGGAECGRLIIQNGGVFYSNSSGNGSSTIGGKGGQGSVYISGDGSEWVDSTLVVIGEEGGIGLLDVNNTGQFIGNALWLALLDSSKGTVIVSDTASYLELSEEFLMGIGPNSEGHLTISNSAIGILRSGLQVGIANSSNCDVTVKNETTSLVISDTTFIGKSGSGGINVLSGADMFSSTTVIPGDWGGIGSTLVDGDSSTWDISGELWIGQRGVGFVRVTNQGILKAGSIHLGPLGSMDATGGNLIIGGNSMLSSKRGLSVIGGTTIYVDTLLISSGAQILADSVIFEPGGYLGSEDTLSFDVINSGGINPGDTLGTTGIFTVDANYTQLSDGTLFIELSGLTPGDGHDQLVVTGSATLAGSLDVSAINGFEPQVGQTYQILNAGNITGTFENLVTHGGLGVNVAYNPDNLTITITSPLAIGDPRFDESIPNDYALEQNYPNPFNPSTTIKFQIPNPELVTLKIYDLTGREVAVLMNEQKHAGRYSVEFDARALASGMYFYRLEAGEFREIRKMLLVR